jgi:ABC-type proline/glycine betaine transport system substrate-binding protein
VHTDKAVSIAISEIQNRKIKIFPEGLDQYDEGQYIAYYKQRQTSRVGQNVGAISSDAVISSKDLTVEYGDDMDDELFADEAIDTADGGKEYNYRDGAYNADEYESEEYDDYDGYAEESIETMEMDGDDFDYGEEK